MSEPKRIQRKRTKGWRMPEGAVYVGRPSKWGNPYWHAQRFYSTALALDLFRGTANGHWNPALVPDFAPVREWYKDHYSWVCGVGWHPVEAIRRELRGKDLACWCPLDQPCHADVLLEIANA